MSPVLFLRRPPSLRSDMVRLGDWVQTFYSSDNPIANGFRELVSETGGTLARPLQKYRWLTKLFGASTQVVSFDLDYLLEVEQSLQSYI